MDNADPRDAVIMSLADRLYICSRLLTAAAERLDWRHPRFTALIQELEESVHASIEEVAGPDEQQQ